MLPYIITQLFPNVKFFPAQGGSYKEILHFVHLFGTLCVPLHVEIRYDEQNLWSDKSALFIEIIFQPKRNDPCVVPRNPSTKRARQPHSAASPYLPKRRELPPRAPAPYKAKQIFALQGRVLLGEVRGGSGRFGGREPRLSRGGSLPPRSSSSLQGLPIPPKIFV